MNINLTESLVNGFPESINVEQPPGYPMLIGEAGLGTSKCFEAAFRKKGLSLHKKLRIVGEVGDTETIEASPTFRVVPSRMT